MKVFITGDRQMTPIYPMQVTVEVVRALGKGAQIVTGTNVGVEQLVRELTDMAGVQVQVVEQTMLPNGKPDFEGRARAMAVLDDLTEVVAIHSDPHASRIIAALLANVEDKTRLVTPADLLA